ncbi:inositol monophosphatase [Thermithiobacillus tepidarius DSM 3134]|uniref:inositol monophosphatase family protein n=1 Tax=Thermithiobacillus tepidarius TaxID=929 RepID=UPI0003FC3E8D|nr:inositol monophosphatase [Thermithiobacillus tepidarius]
MSHPIHPEAVSVNPERVGELLRQAARECVMPHYRQVEGAHKPDGSIVTAADIACQHFLAQALAAEYPDIVLFGEEMEAGEQDRVLRAGRGRALWFLDPIDGTSNFAAGIPIFGTSLALVVQGEARYGWVYDPLRDELFFAARGQGAWVNGERLRRKAGPALGRAVSVVDLKRLPQPLLQRLAVDMPFHSQRSFGSAVIEWCWLAAGRYHFYVHGGQQLWDWAAGLLILQEAGGVAQNLQGGELDLTRHASQSVLACLDPQLLQAWREWLGEGAASMGQ